MEYFLQQMINGITLGSIYGLIAIGYTMVFGIIGMVNFAHGDVFMLSTFIALIFLMVLTQVLGERQGGERGAAANIGTRLEAGNVEARLEAVRAQRAAYRTAHAGDLREIAMIVAAQRGPTPSGQAAKAQP